MKKALIPGLSDTIAVMQIRTPSTSLFYKGNTNGIICGFDRDMAGAPQS